MSSSPLAIETSRIVYSFPGVFLVVGEALGSLGALLTIVYGALLVGNEYQYEIWKNLLARHPGREVFIFSKWTILVICIVLGSLILLLFAQGMGWLLNSTFQLRGAAVSVSAGTLLLLIGVQAMTPLVAGGFAIMGAVIGRSSVAGIMVGLVWFIADVAGGQFLPGVSRLVSFGVASGSLQSHITGKAAPFGLLLSLVVVLGYVVIPIVIAASIFRKRDLVGAS